MPVAKELWEMELGRAAHAAIEGIYGSESLEPLAENSAVKLLQKIQDILNDKTLSDFDCVEEIVSVLAGSNISTTRHDFG